MLSELLKVTKNESEEMIKLRERNPEEMQKDVDVIKEWWKKQPHLPPNDGDDKKLAALIQLNKFSLEKLKKKLDYFYAIPHLYPMFFRYRDPTHPNIQLCRQNYIYCPLPHLTEDFSRITVVKRVGTDTECPINYLCHVILMFADLRMNYDECLFDQLICDLSAMKLSHIKDINPVDLKQIFDVVQKGYSDAIRGIHVLNPPSYTTAIINLLKSLMKEKFLSRIYVHSSNEELQEYFSKKILPVDFGGNEKPLQELQDEWTKYLVSQKDWLQNKSIRESNEKLRTGPPLENDILGIQGSFKQICID